MRRNLGQAIPILKEMPHPFVSSVVNLSVAAIELPHAEREVQLRGFNQEMVVVVHQAMGMTQPAIPIDHRASSERQSVRWRSSATMSGRALPRRVTGLTGF